MSGKQHFRSDNDDDRVKKNPAIKKPRRPTHQDLMDAWLTDDSEEYGSENLSDTIGLSSQRLVPDTVGYKRDFMKLSDYLVEDALIDELQADEKEDAIRELVESLVQVGELEASELDSVVEAVMERELNSSTALGRGVALPHARHPAVSEVIGVLGRSTKGMDFSAIDDEPVHAVILIISPPGPSEPYLGVLSMITKLFGYRSVCRQLRESNRQELIRLINRAHEYLED